eukprot:963845-Alexandrium_andersonii.AAC.1
MSASLVGSEMCIRDRLAPLAHAGGANWGGSGRANPQESSGQSAGCQPPRQAQTSAGSAGTQLLLLV